MRKFCALLPVLLVPALAAGTCNKAGVMLQSDFCLISAVSFRARSERVNTIAPSEGYLTALEMLGDSD